MVIGALIAPAFYIYTLYMKNQRRTQTEQTLTMTTGTLGGYRSVYGRYPCPAPLSVSRNDATYGYEECSPATPGITQVTNSSGKTVLIGALPFRTLGTTEDDAYDKFNNRLLYAVTESQTDSDTFTMQGGAIGIVDIKGNSLVSPTESAHFVVISPNDNARGAWTREGVLVESCPPETELENENCDLDDATFLKSSRRQDIDDRVSYMTDIPISHWQIAEDPGHQNDIHTIKAGNLAIGLDLETPPTAGAGAIDVSNYGGLSDEASIRVKGSVFSQRICDNDGNNCFDPTVIYGLHADSEGMDCGDEFLIGIRNGGPICRDELTFQCPSGTFLKGLDPDDGTLICDAVPNPPCADASVTTSCGESRSVEETYSGGYSYAYSGKCYYSSVSDNNAVENVKTILASGGTEEDVKAYISSVNAMPRVKEDCGASEDTALVRDSFLCESGSWGPHDPAVSQYDETYASEMAHERKKIDWDFPYDPLANERKAEGLNVAYGIDVRVSGGKAGNHDCWCREDFGIGTPDCSNGLTGHQITLWKHICPQTDYGEWVHLYTDDYTFCGCSAAHIGPEYAERCYEYFDAPSEDQVSGSVYRERDRICPSGPSGPADFTDWNYDISECKCHEDFDYDVTYCPYGTTNSFTFKGYELTDIAEIHQRQWKCPTGDGGAVTTEEEAGDWTSYTTVHKEPCICDPTLYEEKFSSCPSNLTGPPNAIKKRRDWNCSTNDWGTWYIVSNSCYACAWTPPAGSGNFQSTAGQYALSESCSCGDVGSCYRSAGAGLYEVWTGCQCSP